MTKTNPRVAVTPPPFCASAALRGELTRVFPCAVFNPENRYFDERELIGFLKNADAAVVGRDPVTAAVLRALPGIKIVAKYGVGLDNIDQAALAHCGVTLGWTAGVNKRSVAELTLCFMLGLCHKAFMTGYALKQGRWIKDGGWQLQGKTVGIVGCGHIGQEVIGLLQPFGCRILVCDILDMSDFCRAAGAAQVAFEVLLATADIVSLHVPLTESTQNLIDAHALARMRPEAWLVNTSRGAVVDTMALRAALAVKKIAGAALDVFPVEPTDDPDLLRCPGLMATPHIGGNSAEAVEAMGRSAIQHLAAYFKK